MTELCCRRRKRRANYGPDSGRIGGIAMVLFGSIYLDGLLWRLNRGNLSSVLYHHRIGDGAVSVLSVALRS